MVTSRSTPTPFPIVAPYGSWKSPITADLIVASTIGLAAPTLDESAVYWQELRPGEGGRTVVLRQEWDGTVQELTPASFNVRTRVHEYGGGAFSLAEGRLFFSNFVDQRLYCWDRADKSSDLPKALTPRTEGGSLRYADGVVNVQKQEWLGIREDHRAVRDGQGEVVNTIVKIALASSEQEGEILVSGHDFYAAPCLSPGGKHLAWLAWNHPNLPWDGTELWVGTFGADGQLMNCRKVAGGIQESIFQPLWSPDGLLYFVSDRSNWWNLYRCDPRTVPVSPEPLYPLEGEFGLPQWVFGMRTYGFISEREILCTYTQQGTWYLARLNIPEKSLHPIDTPYTEISSVQVLGDRAVFLGGSVQEPTAVVVWDLNRNQGQVIKRSAELSLDRRYFSIPEAIAFPTENHLQAYGIYYPPTNPDYQAPAGERPPLLVKSHGGPTASARQGLNLGIQYWTSRGFGVLDVNYGGSTGYGRRYRERLKGQWGIVDVQDCANGARYLVERGDVDGDRLTIEGGSAGGYTTLCALTFTDVFKAGASRYGVSDLQALAEDTHKFESRYLDHLIGPYPEQQDLYAARSPLFHIDRLNCPVIFFQGLEDKIVPPNQAEMMVAALKAKGIPVAYVAFPGEQHGFRKAENIKRALEGELSFYAQVFGFELADVIEPVVIEM